MHSSGQRAGAAADLPPGTVVGVGRYAVGNAGGRYFAVTRRCRHLGYPSGDQSSLLAYQGSIAVPDLCGGGQLRLDQGGTFTASVG